MSTKDLKLSIIQLLENTTDAEVLQSIYVLLTRLQPEASSDTVGYEADGEPISEEELIHSILEGSRQVREGEKISMEDLKRELGL